MDSKWRKRSDGLKLRAEQREIKIITDGFRSPLNTSRKYTGVIPANFPNCLFDIPKLTRFCSNIFEISRYMSTSSLIFKVYQNSLANMSVTIVTRVTNVTLPGVEKIIELSIIILAQKIR